MIEQRWWRDIEAVLERCRYRGGKLIGIQIVIEINAILIREPGKPSSLLLLQSYSAGVS